MYQYLISVGKRLNLRYFIAAAARASQFSKIREEGLGYVCKYFTMGRNDFELKYYSPTVTHDKTFV